MKKLEDFDQKFVLASSSMHHIAGGAGGSQQNGPTYSTCEDNCGDSTQTILDDNGRFFKTVNTIYDVEC